MKITLDSLERHALPFDNPGSKWIFTETRGKSASPEDQAQISPLSKEAALFLKDHTMNREIKCTGDFFKIISVFEGHSQEWQAVKNYLHDLNLPMGRNVIVAYSDDLAFILTWKMLIKYSHRIFTASDKAVWDMTMNWKLEFEQPGKYSFGKDLIEPV